MLLNFAVLGLFAINLALRSQELNRASISIVPLLLSIVGVSIVFYSGYLGGHLVYNDGIAVGRHRRHTDIPDKTISVATTNDFVSIAPLDKLEAGSMLRADVGGHVIAITRIGNDIYAFQEFCTHRFGPLSEGQIEKYEVMCPWHRSCFDVRTGKVTQGPAKLDLKTYEARVEDGQIQVRVDSR